MAHFEPVKRKPEPKEIWLISFADLMTLMMSLFILLFSFCKVDVETLKVVAQSFKPGPEGTPFLLQGADNPLESVAADIQASEFGDSLFVTFDERGVVTVLNATAMFGPGSADLEPAAEKQLSRFSKFLYAFSNPIVVEGHTDNIPIQSSRFPSNWELSAARAAAVARWLERNGVQSNRLEATGFGSTRPRFKNDSPQKRALNRRVEIIMKPWPVGKAPD